LLLHGDLLSGLQICVAAYPRPSFIPARPSLQVFFFPCLVAAVAQIYYKKTRDPIWEKKNRFFRPSLEVETCSRESI
jgi:hypothetical protein